MCAHLMRLWLGMGYRAAWRLRDVSRDAKGLGTSSKLRCYVGLRIVTLSKNLIKYENRYSQIFNIAIGNCTQHTWIFFYFVFNDLPQPAPQIKWQFLYPPQPAGYETTRASLMQTSRFLTQSQSSLTWKIPVLHKLLDIFIIFIQVTYSALSFFFFRNLILRVWFRLLSVIFSSSILAEAPCLYRLYNYSNTKVIIIQKKKQLCELFKAYLLYVSYKQKIILHLKQ